MAHHLTALAGGPALALPTPGGDGDPALLIACVALGFLVGIAGHVVRSRTLVATGIGLIFVATVIVPFALHVSDGG